MRKRIKVTDSIPVGPGPRFETFGAGSVWTLNQGDGTISRVDAKTRKVVATIEVGIPGTGGEIAFGLGHVWATVFQIPISEIDPGDEHMVINSGSARVAIPFAPDMARCGSLTCTRTRSGGSILSSCNVLCLSE